LMSLCQFGNGMFGSGPTGFVLASHGHHLHGRRGRGFDAARWDGLRQSALCQGMQRQCRLGRGNHHRAGTEADRRGRGGMCFGEAGCCRLRFVRFADGQCSSMQGRVRQFVATKLVQARGRINAGGLGWCKFDRCLVGLVSASPGYAGQGWVKAALVIGTMPLRRGGAEWKGGQDGR
jgi:hypothetical protein